MKWLMIKALKNHILENGTYESIEELKYPHEHDSDQLIFINLATQMKKKINDPRVQAMFKRSRHNNIPIFIIHQENHKLPKRTITAHRNVYHRLKENNFRDVQDL